ncbi:MAG TPA: hypothetical protein VGM67_14340 [Gemmatimonadaceae bacterium]|jgi:hypothetical protein
MRLYVRALCAVALAGCSDVKLPTASKPQQAANTPAAPTPRPPDPQPPAVPPSVADRLDSMFVHRMEQVAIPADDFSEASDAVHPDMACPPASWNGARCWLMYTPYKNSDPALENPALLFATSDTTWSTPDGIRNPIIPHPNLGYNSDPDHAFDPVTGRMIQIYRVVSDTFNTIMIMSTANAKHWTKPVVAFQERAHDAVSPALIIEPDRTAKIWYVRSGTAGCTALSSTIQLRTAVPDSTSGYEQSTWSAPVATDLAIPNYVPWHLDVVELAPGAGYVALIAAFPRGASCGTSDLWLATSPDGLHWQPYAMPIMWRTMATATTRSLVTWYRGTMRYDAQTDSLDIWPSAMSKTSWNVYHARFALSDMVTMLKSVKPGDYKVTFTRNTLAPLHMP